MHILSFSLSVLHVYSICLIRLMQANPPQRFPVQLPGVTSHWQCLPPSPGMMSPNTSLDTTRFEGNISINMR